MEVRFTNSFWKSLNNLTKSENPWYFQYWEHKWYDFKRAIKMLWLYFPIVVKMNRYDYSSILKMMRFQINVLANHIEKHGIEVDRDRLPKIKKMREAVRLLDRMIADEYYEEACLNYKDDSVKKEIELSNQDCDRLFSILRDNIRGWWD